MDNEILEVVLDYTWTAKDQSTQCSNMEFVGTQESQPLADNILTVDLLRKSWLSLGL